MKVSETLKKNLLKYNLHYPVDGRTNEFKYMVVMYGSEKKYLDHLIF